MSGHFLHQSDQEALLSAPHMLAMLLSDAPEEGRGGGGALRRRRRCPNRAAPGDEPVNTCNQCHQM